MTKNRGQASFVVAAAVFTVLSATLAAPIAQADTVTDIKRTVSKDRGKYAPTCPGYTYSPFLETVAQDIAKNETFPVYNGEARSFLGYGDPVAAALTDAYEKGFGPLISECRYTEFGVAFLRFVDKGKDGVVIVIGAPAASAPVAAPVPAGATPKQDPPKADPEPAATLTATAKGDVDRYENPGGNGDPIPDGFVKSGATVAVKRPCTPDAFCALADGTFAWGGLLQNNT